MTNFIRTHLASLARLAMFVFVLAAAVAGVTFRAALTTAETRATSNAHLSRHYGEANAVLRESLDCTAEVNGAARELCVGPLNSSLYYCPQSAAPCNTSEWIALAVGV